MYCRFCGKEIPDNSLYCPNCGKRQSEGTPQEESPMFQIIKKHKNIVLLYIVWCLIHVGLLISSPSEEQFQNIHYFSKTDAFYPYNTSLSKVLQWEEFDCNPLKYVDAYDSSELFFYIILLPFLIWGIEKLVRKIRPKRTTSSTMKGQNGKKFDLSILFVLLGITGIIVITIIGFAIQNEPKREQAAPVDTDSIEEVVDSVIDEYEEYFDDHPQRTEQAAPVDAEAIEEVEDPVEDDYKIDDEKFVVLTTGDTPYSLYYGNNMNCRRTECSGVKVTAPEASDVVVIIKKRNEHGKVAGHAYISAGDTYKIDLPDGTYQTFFYYGDGWNANKDMGNGIKGGFVRNEVFSKDDPQGIYSAVLSYVLQLRRDGNFQAESSNRSEVF